MEQNSVPLSDVCSFWQEFDLDGRRNALDDAALQAAEFQEETVVKRKELAQATRAFKAKVSADVAKAVGPLLKDYQGEVDRLTRRSKHAESSFLELYQQLYEAPDPVTVLHGALGTESQLAQLVAHNAKLEKELQEFQMEAQGIKNRELTIRKLEERCKSLEAELATKIQEFKNAQEEWESQAKEEATSELAAREANLLQALSEAQSQLSSVTRKHRDAQDKLLDLQQTQEGSVVGAAADADLANEELDRAQMQVLSLETEKKQLQQLLQEQAMQPGRAAVEVQALQDDLARARRATAAAQEEVAEAQQRADEAESATAAKMAGMQRALAASEEAQAALQTELSARPTMQQLDGLRREMQALQALQFGSVDVASVDGEASGPAVGFDRALAARVRDLEHQVTMSRLQLSEAVASAENAESSVRKLEGELLEAQKMIATLEEDLQAAEDRAVGSSPTAEAAAGMGDSDHAVLHALCSQRDRFKNKVQELQEALAAANARITAAESDTAAAKADNVALIERLKFVSSYTGTNRRAASLSAAEAGRSVEDRYTKEYEKKLDPFAEFKGKVSARSKAHMPVADKIVYTFGELLFGSKLARLGVVVYIGLLHLLTFSVLSSASHASHDSLHGNDAHCSPAAVAAVLAAQAPSLLTETKAVL